MARICVVRQLYFPRDAKCRREVDALLAAGHDVDIVCLRRGHEPLIQRYGTARIWRIPLAHQRGHLIEYVIEYATILVLMTLILAVLQIRRRFDLIQVNTPPDTLVFAAIVPRLFGAKVLLQLQEPMPEFFATKFGKAKDSRVVRFVCSMEQLSIDFADFAITCTEHMRRAFIARGANPQKVAVVVPSSNEDEFSWRASEPESRAPGRFVLVSHGSIEERYGLDTAIRAIELLKEELPGLRLEIYGEGSYTTHLRLMAAEHGVDDRVTFHGWVPLPELVQAIRDADAGVVAMKRDPFRDLTHCLKMYDFITMRRPAIVSRTWSVDEYFDDASLQKFTADDPADLARAIRELENDSARRADIVARATAANEPYRWQHQRLIYLNAVAALAGDRGADLDPTVNGNVPSQ